MTRQILFGVTVMTLLLLAACTKGPVAGPIATVKAVTAVSVSSSAAPEVSAATAPSFTVCAQMTEIVADQPPSNVYIFIGNYARYLSNADFQELTVDVDKNCPQYSGVLVAEAAARARGARGAPDGPEAAAAKVAAENAKVTYRITGDASSAMITYSKYGDNTAQEDGAPLPWSKDMTLTAGTGRFLSISAVNSGGGSITCSILVAGLVVSTNTSTGSYALVDCNYTE